MRHTDKLIVLAATFALAIPVMAQQPPAGGAPQQPPSAQQPPPSQQPPSAQQPPAAQQASGELVRVDTNAKTLSIKTSSGSDMVFTYSDATKVTGGEQNVAGLATKSGSKVTVHFTMKGQDRIASQIDIEKAGA
jgi:hypothetical protein